MTCKADLGGIRFPVLEVSSVEDAFDWTSARLPAIRKVNVLALGVDEEKITRFCGMVIAGDLVPLKLTVEDQHSRSTATVNVACGEWRLEPRGDLMNTRYEVAVSGEVKYSRRNKPKPKQKPKKKAKKR
jgi:hypothetical protein